MAENGRVHPNCVNAANPYHECGVACLEKIAAGKGKKDKDKKKLGSKIFDVSGSFGRKKKGSESQPKPSQVPDNGHAVSASYPAGARSPPSHFSPKKKVESENSESFSSDERHSEEIQSQDHSFSKAQVRSVQSVRTSGNGTPDRSKYPSKDTVATPTKHEDEKRHASVEVVSYTNGTTSPVVGSMNFSFSGIVRALDESDDEEVQSVISDSCVSVGKYHVRASVSSILQAIIDKYGDIAANCQLESVSMRAYYLECLCSVVQDLQSTPITQLTKSKVREMLAVLKDVESAQIDVSWLRSILNEVFETIDFISQHQTIEAAKANCDRVLVSTSKELEFQMEDLAQKEKAAAEAKARVEETKARLNELELECSRLDKTILSIRSKVEKFEGKTSADGLL